MEVSSLFAEASSSLPQEVTEAVVVAKHVRIDRIASYGHASPDGYWYDQDENEFVLLVSGAARLQFEDKSIELKTGDWINIPAHRKHRVEWTSPVEQTIWLAVFYTDHS